MKWQRNAVRKEIINDPHRFKVVVAGRRWGKTHLAIMWLLSEEIMENNSLWYIAPTYRQGKMIAWPVLKRLFRHHSEAKINESGWRVIRPIDEVVAEVKSMKEKYKMKKVFFVDNGFNLPLDHAKSLCSQLIESDVNIRWNTCLAPFNCDTELIGLMKDAGCGLVPIMLGRPQR